MSADLSIHIRTDEVTLDVLRKFFSNTFGSPYFNPVNSMVSMSEPYSHAYDVVANSPSVHVGEVSWLKAAITGDKETFVPNAIEVVQSLIGSSGNIVIDDELIAQISEAMQLPNNTDYDVADENEVIEFLKAHKGSQAFTVSW